jgi:hypothetical protein
MELVSRLRRRADNCFRFAKNTRDKSLRAKALELGEQYLVEADALAQQINGNGALAGIVFGKMSATKRDILLGVARIEEHLRAFDTGSPRERSIHGELLSALCDQRNRLLQSCGMKPANDRGSVQRN